MLNHINNLKVCFTELSRLSSMDNCSADSLNNALRLINMSSAEQFMLKDVLNAMYLATKEITLVAPYLGLLIVNGSGKCLFELMNWNIYLIDNRFSVQPKGMAELVANHENTHRENTHRENTHRENTSPRPENNNYNLRPRDNNRNDYNERNERNDRNSRGRGGSARGHSDRGRGGDRFNRRDGGYYPREPMAPREPMPPRDLAYAVVSSDSGTPSVLERVNHSRPDPRVSNIYKDSNGKPVSKYDKNKERNDALKAEKKKAAAVKKQDKTLPVLSDALLTEMLNDVTGGNKPDKSDNTNNTESLDHSTDEPSD